MSNKIECPECGNFIYENYARCKCGWQKKISDKKSSIFFERPPVLRDFEVLIQKNAQKSMEEANRLGISGYEYYKMGLGD